MWFAATQRVLIRSPHRGASASILRPSTPVTLQGLICRLRGRLLEALGRHGYEGRDAPVFIQSFETPICRCLRSMTQIPLVQLVAATGAPFDLMAAGEARNYAGMVTRPGLARVAGYADAVGVEKTLVIPRHQRRRL